MTGEDLACRDVVELLTDYLDGALSPVEQEAIEHHLAVCGGCAAFLDQLRTTIAVTAAVARRDGGGAPSGVDAAMARFRRSRR